MKKIDVSLMVVAVVLAVIASIAPSAAMPSGDHEITCVGHDFDGKYSTWTYQVTSGYKPSISHWDLTWCNPGAIVKVSEEPWEYGTDKHTKITGIKFDKRYKDGETRKVSFMLLGDFPMVDVKVGIKAGKKIVFDEVKGPLNASCDTEIPEFRTIAIPIASILGLLFFFNYRKRRREQ